MWRICATSKSPITATMMMAPSAAWGSVSNSGVKKTTVARTMPAVMIEATGVRAPAVSLTAVRENPPVTGYPPKSPEATLAIPRPTSSWLASTS